MDDLYREILVKRSSTGKDKALKYLVIAVTALVIAAGILFFPPLILGGIVLGILDYYFVLPNFDLEYEYLYVNGDIDIDKIMAKTRRKRVASYSKDKLEIMAPEGSAQLASYLKEGKPKDYTSLDPGQKAWILVFGTERGADMVRLELPDDLAKDMRRYAPRKVFFE